MEPAPTKRGSRPITPTTRAAILDTRWRADRAATAVIDWANPKIVKPMTMNSVPFHVKSG
jgi:hypothetical protein